MLWDDPSLVRYVPPAGGCRSPGNHVALITASDRSCRAPLCEYWWSALTSATRQRSPSSSKPAPTWEPLFRRCRALVRCSLLPGEIAHARLIAGHVIQPCWCRLWVSQTACDCHWVMSTTAHVAAVGNPDGRCSVTRRGDQCPPVAGPVPAAW